MKTTVMFVADSVPLSGVPVRLGGKESTDEWVTDDEGKIEFDLDLGTHTFAVSVDDEWVERTIHRQGHAPMFVVNIRRNDAQNISALNTLQIDLANLVGDRYVFETVLGRGGMGVVVKAVDRMLNRPVAIKMLSDELRENEEAQQIFLVEARNLATLSHPNLVAIHDILNVSGRVLMVFEYVLGENVEQKIESKGRLDQKEVLRIAIQLTRCVAYLHTHDLIHRDLKPANIIMQAEGTLKLIDFGLARSLNELYIRGTRVRGTPAYMAPEQIQGIHLTTQTDIYQIGISMYEMLAGELPFKSGDLAYAHVHVQPPPLGEKVPELDAELVQLVHACLSKQPRDRPASAELLLEQLQQIYARIASKDSQPHGLFEPSSGPIPAVTSTEVDVSAPAPQAAPSLSVEDVGDVSFAEEVVGGSNRGLMLMVAVGLVSLAIAGFVLFGSEDTPEATASVATTEESTPTAIADPAPTEPLETDGADESGDASVAGARGFVRLGVATARGRVSGLAAATKSPDAAAEPKRTRPSRAVDSAPERGTPTPTPIVEDRPRPAAEPAEERRAPEPAEPRVVQNEKKTKKKPSLKSTDDESSGLLSVDGEESKTLLPVGE